MKAFASEKTYKKVVELLKDEKRGRLLDMGAGTGALSHRLNEIGFLVEACDIKPANFIPRGISCKKVDLNNTLPYPRKFFDYVVATEIIEHLENPWNLMRELYRITKPGGIVILSTPNLHNWYVRSYFLLSSKLFNFLSSYKKIGHITPIFLWNLERMVAGKFKIERITTNESKIPLLNIPLPFKSLFFGQCIIVKMKRI